VTSKEILIGVTVDDIAGAIEEIKTGKQRMPTRGSMTWCIQFQEVAYPTNDVLALAVKAATGETFVPGTRKSGKETIKALEQMLHKNLKFKVVFRQAGSTAGGD
jgi:hypothetical protein